MELDWIFQSQRILMQFEIINRVS